MTLSSKMNRWLLGWASISIAILAIQVSAQTLSGASLASQYGGFTTLPEETLACQATPSGFTPASYRFTRLAASGYRFDTTGSSSNLFSCSGVCSPGDTMYCTAFQSALTPPAPCPAQPVCSLDAYLSCPGRPGSAHAAGSQAMAVSSSCTFSMANRFSGSKAHGLACISRDLASPSSSFAAQECAGDENPFVNGDFSATGAQAQVGASFKATLAAGDAPRSVAPGNLMNTNAGSISIDIRPTWNGNDGLVYRLFLFGTADGNGIVIQKDADNKILCSYAVNGAAVQAKIPISQWLKAEKHSILMQWNHSRKVMSCSVDEASPITAQLGAVLPNAGSMIVGGTVNGGLPAKSEMTLTIWRQEKPTIAYCAGDETWSPDLDSKSRASCELSKLKWTGTKCCGEFNDRQEFYADPTPPADKSKIECQPGQKVCQGTQLKTCDFNFRFGITQDCPNGCGGTPPACKPQPSAITGQAIRDAQISFTSSKSSGITGAAITDLTGAQVATACTNGIAKDTFEEFSDGTTSFGWDVKTFPSTSILVKSGTGNPGSALEFKDQNPDKLYQGHASMGKVIPSTASGSVEFDAKASQRTGMFSFMISSAKGTMIYAYMHFDGTFKHWDTNYYGGYRPFSVSHDYQPNVWYHIKIAWTQSGFDMYVNGQKLNSALVPFSYPANAGPAIGFSIATGWDAIGPVGTYFIDNIQYGCVSTIDSDYKMYSISKISDVPSGTTTAEDFCKQKQETCTKVDWTYKDGCINGGWCSPTESGGEVKTYSCTGNLRDTRYDGSLKRIYCTNTKDLDDPERVEFTDLNLVSEQGTENVCSVKGTTCLYVDWLYKNSASECPNGPGWCPLKVPGAVFKQYPCTSTTNKMYAGSGVRVFCKGEPKEFGSCTSRTATSTHPNNCANGVSCLAGEVAVEGSCTHSKCDVSINRPGQSTGTPTSWTCGGWDVQSTGGPFTSTATATCCQVPTNSMYESCQVRTTTVTSPSSCSNTATCQSGEVAVGGGCEHTNCDVRTSQPSGETGWSCGGFQEVGKPQGPFTSKAFVTCCKPKSSTGLPACTEATKDIPDFVVSCSTRGQLCSPAYSVSVNTGSTLKAQFNVRQSHCSSIRIHFLVDGKKVYTSPFFGYPGSAGPSTTGIVDLGPVSAGTHKIEVQGEGIVGGCNAGALGSWGGALKIITSECPGAQVAAAAASSLSIAGAPLSDTPGACWNSTWMQTGRLIEGTDGKVISVSGRLLGCSLDPSDPLLSIRDQPTGLKLIEPAPACTLAHDIGGDSSLNLFCSPREDKWVATPSNLARTLSANPKDVNDLECCQGGSCWAGGPECVPDQSEDSSLSTVNGFRCIRGVWTDSLQKFTLDRSERGFCPDKFQCLVNPAGSVENNDQPEKFFTATTPLEEPGCIADGQFIKEGLCVEGNWTSRAKAVAFELMNIGETDSKDDYAMFCGDYNEVLTFTESDADLKTYLDRKCTRGGKTVECVNNFCALRYKDTAVAFGTSLNVPIDDEVQGFLKAMELDTKTCDSAKIFDGRFHECSRSGLFYNAVLEAIISKPPAPQNQVTGAQGLDIPRHGNVRPVLRREFERILHGPLIEIREYVEDRAQGKKETDQEQVSGPSTPPPSSGSSQTSTGTTQTGSTGSSQTGTTTGSTGTSQTGTSTGTTGSQQTTQTGTTTGSTGTSQTGTSTGTTGSQQTTQTGTTTGSTGTASTGGITAPGTAGTQLTEAEKAAAAKWEAIKGPMENVSLFNGLYLFKAPGRDYFGFLEKDVFFDQFVDVAALDYKGVTIVDPVTGKEACEFIKDRIPPEQFNGAGERYECIFDPSIKRLIFIAIKRSPTQTGSTSVLRSFWRDMTSKVR